MLAYQALGRQSEGSDDEDLRLAHRPISGPYPARVRIALAEKNLQSRVQFVTVNLWKGEHKKPEFLARNYSGTLPVLELDDGTFIAECTAITEYLDALDGAPALTGRSPREKGVIHMMSKRAELELLDAISVYFHHATPGLGPDVEIYQNAELGVPSARQSPERYALLRWHFEKTAVRRR